MATATKGQDEVIHEYPAIGRYRLRVLQQAGKPSSLDIREYVNAEKFEGFTRRGIRLHKQEDINALKDIINDAAARGWFE